MATFSQETIAQFPNGYRIRHQEGLTVVDIINVYNDYQYGISFIPGNEDAARKVLLANAKTDTERARVEAAFKELADG